jgi:hypothetical protein
MLMPERSLEKLLNPGAQEACIAMDDYVWYFDGVSLT